MTDDEKRTVMFITRKWPPAMGGMETYSVRLTEELAKLMTVSIAKLPGRADGSPPSWVSLLLFPFSVLRAWLSEGRKMEIIHIGDMALWPLALLSRFSSRNRIVALSAHGTDVAYHRRNSLRGRMYGAYLRLGSRLLREAKVLSNSRATQEVCAETGWRNSAVIPLATDFSADLLEGTHNGRILFAGRLVKRKGCGWFIREVLPLLPDEVVLDVAGTVWDEDEKAALDNPRVNFCGSLDQEQLTRAYREALCVVIPNVPVATSEYEGFGLVAPEAAVSGAVVLASRRDGLLDAVLDGETGMLVEPSAPKEWAATILAVADWSPQKRAAFVSDSQRAVREHFSWQRVARETLAAYSSKTEG